MRPLMLGQPPMGDDGQKLDWCIRALQQIEQASQAEALAISDPFTITNGTPKHTLDVTAATLLDVSKVVGTLLLDMKKRGVNSGNG